MGHYALSFIIFFQKFRKRLIPFRSQFETPYQQCRIKSWKGFATLLGELTLDSLKNTTQTQVGLQDTLKCRGPESEYIFFLFGNENQIPG